MADLGRSKNGPRPRRTLVRYTAWLPTTPIRAPTAPAARGRRRLRAAALRERLDEEISRAERHGTAELPAGGDRQPRASSRASTAASCASRRSPTSRRRCGASCAASTGSAAPRRRRAARDPARRRRARAARSSRGARSSGCSTIKVEAAGARRPLRISVGLAAGARVSTRGAAGERARRPATGNGDEPHAALEGQHGAESPRRAGDAQPDDARGGSPPRVRTRAQFIIHSRCSPDQSCGCCA